MKKLYVVDTTNSFQNQKRKLKYLVTAIIENNWESRLNKGGSLTWGNASVSMNTDNL